MKQMEITEAMKRYLTSMVNVPDGMRMKAASVSIDLNEEITSTGEEKDAWCITVHRVEFARSSAWPLLGSHHLNSTVNEIQKVHAELKGKKGKRGRYPALPWGSIKHPKPVTKAVKRKPRTPRHIADGNLPPKSPALNKSIKRRYTTSEMDIAAIRSFFSKWKGTKGFINENQLTAIATTEGIRYNSLTDAQRIQMLNIFNDLRKELGYDADGKVIKK